MAVKRDKSFLFRLSGDELRKLHILAKSSDSEGAGAWLRLAIAQAWRDAPVSVKRCHSVPDNPAQLKLWE